MHEIGSKHEPNSAGAHRRQKLAQSFERDGVGMPNGDRGFLLFRAAHSLKGAAQMMGFGQVGAAAHRLEDTLESLRGQDEQFCPALGDRLLREVDALDRVLAVPPEVADALDGDALTPTRTSLPLQGRTCPHKGGRGLTREQ